MVWINEMRTDKNVAGAIITGSYDQKLDYAIKIMNNIEVFYTKLVLG